MIDFSNAKQIFIPEGEVALITRGDEVLWEKQTKKYNQELYFIESTGTQWIDTGLRLNQDSKLEMLINILDTNSNVKIFGSRSSATKNSFSVVSAGANLTTDFYDHRNNRLQYAVSGDEFLEISISNKELKINDSEKAVSTYTDFTTPYNAYLFDCSGSYPIGYTSAQMRLYYCKIYDNDVLVRDFVPVLDLNNVPCMYDKVSEELFYNNGSGEFTYG